MGATLEQITKLIDAGYTRDEITALLAQDQGSEPRTQQPAPQQAPQQQQQQQQQQNNNHDESLNENKLDAAIAKMEQLAESMAKVAIMNSQQPALQSTDDFLAQIINPRHGKETK